MTREEVAALLEHALDQLIEFDFELIRLGVCERAVMFRLGHYIASSGAAPEGKTVDCEYNRHLAGGKTLGIPPRRNPGNRRRSDVIPDILIHSRGNDDQNVLVAEIKRPTQPMGRDRLKLARFRTEYRYAHAAQIVIGHGRLGDLVREIRWIDPD